MTPENSDEIAEVARLLERQRPPVACESLPPVPEDMRRNWEAHFGQQRSPVKSRRLAWLAALAAASAVGVWFFQAAPFTATQSQQSSEGVRLSLDASLAFAEPSAQMSAIAMALLRYQDPATAGLFVRE